MDEETDEPEGADMTKIVPKSNSKVEDLRENRINEIISKSEKAANANSDGMLKEAEERKEKKRKARKKKNADIIIDANLSNNNDLSNNSVINAPNNTVNTNISNTLNITNNVGNNDISNAENTNVSLKNNLNTSTNQTLDDYIKVDDIKDNTNGSAENVNKPKKQNKRKKAQDHNVSLNTDAINGDNKVDYIDLNNSINNTFDNLNNTNNEIVDNGNSTAKKQRKKKELTPEEVLLDNQKA